MSSFVSRVRIRRTLVANAVDARLCGPAEDSRKPAEAYLPAEIAFIFRKPWCMIVSAYRRRTLPISALPLDGEPHHIWTQFAIAPFNFNLFVKE